MIFGVFWLWFVDSGTMLQEIDAVKLPAACSYHSKPRHRGWHCTPSWSATWSSSADRMPVHFSFFSKKAFRKLNVYLIPQESWSPEPGHATLGPCDPSPFAMGNSSSITEDRVSGPVGPVGAVDYGKLHALPVWKYVEFTWIYTLEWCPFPMVDIFISLNYHFPMVLIGIYTFQW